MLLIFNTKKNNEIRIDDNHHCITIMPKNYDEEYPSILIELKNIDFERHSLKCTDCNSLVEDFGTNTPYWFIKWQNKTYRLNLSNLGNGINQTLVSWAVSYYFTGTKLKFMISTETIEDLKLELETNIEVENYEHCAFLRDRIEQFED